MRLKRPELGPPTPNLGSSPSVHLCDARGHEEVAAPRARERLGADQQPHRGERRRQHRAEYIEEAEVQRCAEPEGGDGVDSERKGIAPPAQVADAARGGAGGALLGGLWRRLHRLCRPVAVASRGRSTRPLGPARSRDLDRRSLHLLRTASDCRELTSSVMSEGTAISPATLNEVAFAGRFRG